MAKRSKPKAIATLADLVPDAKNANKGTARGAGMLERSLRDYGAGRSVLVDRHGAVIAGNKTLEAAKAVGVTDVVVVPTTGKKLVVHQRTDLDLERDVEAKAMAIADNRTNEVDLEWTADPLKALAADGVDMQQFFRAGEWAKLMGGEDATSTEQIPEMALQPFEQHDYLVFVFSNSQDWQGVCDALGVRREKVTLGKTTKVGLGRVLAGSMLAARLQGPKKKKGGKRG